VATALICEVILPEEVLVDGSFVHVQVYITFSKPDNKKQAAISKFGIESTGGTETKPYQWKGAFLVCSPLSDT